MRQETIRLVDDIDGTDADETITFAVGGTSYEIDLNEKHMTAFHESFAEWIEHARVVKTTGRKTPTRKAAATAVTRTSADKAQLRAIREWAAANGFELADRGRIPAKVIAAYHAAA